LHTRSLPCPRTTEEEFETTQLNETANKTDTKQQFKVPKSANRL